MIRRLHTLSGLLVLSQLLVYGIAGIVATLQESPDRPNTPYSTASTPFSRTPGETDKQVAERVYELLRPPLARPIPDWFLQHTPDGNLLLEFHNINGIYRVVVLQNQLRVESIRNDTGHFFEDIHAVASGEGETAALLSLWGIWNEAGMWLLLFFCATGVWLWLRTRLESEWTWIVFGVSALSLAAFWMTFV